MSSSSRSTWNFLPISGLVVLCLLLLVYHAPVANGFVPITPSCTSRAARYDGSLYLSSDEKKSTEGTGVFVPLDESEKKEADDDEEEEDAVPIEKVESLGRGAAKAKRGRRKGSSAAGSSTPTPKPNLAPEEVFYEGPPAITETLAPTLSIVTVIGIIPAAAAWARQAWVRYRITNRRIRVNSGVGGKDMAEIVYPDIVELRTARRLFGDGDMVAFLRDGARFEMRNIPNFEETIEFVLKQVSPDVAAKYRAEGEVNN